MKSQTFSVAIWLLFGHLSFSQPENPRGKMDKVITVETTVRLNKQKAFDLFLKKGHLEKWLTKKAFVNDEIGGAYELFWEPQQPRYNSTMGCKIVAIDRPDFLSFEWRGPKQFDDFMNHIRPLTNVTVMFFENNEFTKIILLHNGWRQNEQWDQARDYFSKAWQMAFEELESYANKEVINSSN